MVSSSAAVQEAPVRPPAGPVDDGWAPPALRRPRSSRRAIAALVVVAFGAALLWISAGDHALYPPDEGRYGSVSMRMADGGDWLVPVFEDELHLKKPPLTYWAQAACLKLLGHHELAVRAPSLVAATLSLLVLLGLGWQVGGPRVGLMAVACLAVMPMFVVVSRLAITDAMLSLFWLGALGSGYLAVERGRSGQTARTSQSRQAWIWTAIMWACVALGLLTKGPLALTPVAIILLWIGCSRQWNLARALRIPMGLPLAALPILLWVAGVMYWHPEAWKIWWGEMIDRAVGSGDHPQPPWYYLPVFLAGLFPATAMLIVPGWNLSWRAAWEKLQRSETACLWALAVVVPLGMFTLISGKLASYLLPLCAPLALLTATMLERWLTGEADVRKRMTRPPEVVGTLTISTLCVALVATAVAWTRQRELWWLGAPLLIAPAAAAWMWWSWKRQPDRRALGLAASWLALVACWLYAFEIEDRVRHETSAAVLVERARSLTDSARPLIATYGFSDSTITFYNHREGLRPRQPSELQSLLAGPEKDVVLVALKERWTELERDEPALAAAFHPIGEWQHWADDPTLIMRPDQAAKSAARAEAEPVAP